jgi:membrane protease YdiL (CAAX protease family)
MKVLNLEDLKEEIIEKNGYQQPKQKIKLIAGVVAPPFLFLIMFFIYQIFGMIFGSEIGWFLGLVVYWMLCGLLFSAWLIGFKMIKNLSSPRKLKLKFIPIIIFPMVMALIFSYLSGIEYKQPNLLAIIFFVITVFGNGIFEEIIWRGAYMELYPKNFFLRFIYSTIWYAVFHFASGSLSSNSNVLGLVIGSSFFGIYLALIAKWTNNIWWCIICHILGGFVMMM